MLQAVIGGMGVGLGRTLLVEGDVEAGYLKAVGSSIRMRSGYWLVCSASFAETNRFERLRDWLKSEIQTTARKSMGGSI
jgi:LysR family glycine cleavage system transcriptional activator